MLDICTTMLALASHTPQRVLVLVAVQNSWETCTTDISKAFLQGVTYKERADKPVTHCGKSILSSQRKLLLVCGNSLARASLPSQ